jgi:glutathione gamma-glutamylcysteinyltransferase
MAANVQRTKTCPCAPPPLKESALQEPRPNRPVVPGVSLTFYKRELPSPPAIAFASPEGQRIFANAIAAGTMQSFFPLIEQFRTQDEPAYCGLASVAMVLNALSIDPRRPWKGVWRYFHEQMLDCCYPLDKVKLHGITLEQAACLARCNGATVEVFPHGKCSVAEFRTMIQSVCSGIQSSNGHLVVSYSRKAFKQTGDGHFSPVGGYDPGEDRVLILDTARFKYPPHWVLLEDLYNAMEATDSVTGKSRGFMRIALAPRLDSVLFTLDVRVQRSEWEAAFEYLNSASLEKYNLSDAGAEAEEVVKAVAVAAPVTAVMNFLAVRTSSGVQPSQSGMCVQTSAVETLLSEIRGTRLYSLIQEWFTKRVDTDVDREKMTVYMMLLPEEVWETVSADLPDGTIDAIKGLVSPKGMSVLSYEIEYLKEQYHELMTVEKEQRQAEALGPC